MSQPSHNPSALWRQRPIVTQAGKTVRLVFGSGRERFSAKETRISTIVCSLRCAPFAAFTQYRHAESKWLTLCCLHPRDV
jgi:hypothetical protein